MSRAIAYKLESHLPPDTWQRRPRHLCDPFASHRTATGLAMWDQTAETQGAFGRRENEPHRGGAGVPPPFPRRFPAVRRGRWSGAEE